MATVVVSVSVSADHIWQCKCKTDNWHFVNDKCLVCNQTFRGEKKKLDARWNRGAYNAACRRERRKPALYCSKCFGIFFDKECCPHCSCVLTKGASKITLAIAIPSILLEDPCAS